MLPGTSDERLKMYAEFDLMVGSFIQAVKEKDQDAAVVVVNELCNYLYADDARTIAFLTFIMSLHAETLIALLETSGINVTDYLFERSVHSNAVSVDPAFAQEMEAGDVHVEEEQTE